MKKGIILLLILGGFCFFKSGLVLAAAAIKPSILGSFGVWTVYKFKEGKADVCYMSAFQTQASPKAGRDDIFLTVTHRPKDKSYNVVSYAGNYDFKKKTEPTLRIDKNKAITLMPVSDMAWGKDTSDDRKMVDLMARGGEAYVSGISVRGTKITDTFSLKGFAKAYDAITKACEK